METSPETIKTWYDDYPSAAPPAATGIMSAVAPATDAVKPIDPNAYKVKTTDATATNWNVDPNQTVQGQIGGIIAKDSPLMQQAATSAKQQANQRGLINSSMAVGAGHDAVYRAAMPIAQQDASTYGNAARYNADAANSMSTFNAGAQNQAAAQSAQLGLSADQSNQSASLAQAQQAYDAALKTSIQAADFAGRSELTKLDGQIRQSLADTEAKFKTGMQTSASMAQTYQGMIDNITRIMASPDLDAAAKQASINNLTKLYNGALQSQEAISGLQLGSLIDFTGTVPADKPTAPVTPTNPTAPTGPTPNPSYDYPGTSDGA